MTLFGMFTKQDIVAILAILGVVNTIFWVYLRSQYVPRSYIFCPRDGTPLYRTVDDCVKLEKKKDMERKESEERIEKNIDNKFKEIKKSNDQFVENLKDLFKTQTKTLSDTIKDAVRS